MSELPAEGPVWEVLECVMTELPAEGPVWVLESCHE